MLDLMGSRLSRTSATRRATRSATSTCRPRRPASARLAAAVHARRRACAKTIPGTRTSSRRRKAAMSRLPPAAPAATTAWCRSCRWAARRWPTRCCDRAGTGRARADATRWNWCSARRCALVQITETVPRPRPVPRLRLLLVVLRHDAAAAPRACPAADRASGELGSDEPGGRSGQQRRLPAARTTGSAGVPVLGIEPAREHRAGGASRSTASPRCEEFFDVALARRAGRRRASGPTSSTPTTCWRTSPT